MADDLKKNGVKVWIAPESIHSGEDWVKAINRAFKECSHFTVVLTPVSMKSGWVERELNTAIHLEIKGLMKVIPLRLRQCELPPLLSVSQMIPFEREYQTGLRQLVETLGLQVRLKEPVTPKRTHRPTVVGPESQKFMTLKTVQEIRSLQTDLRKLGYLESGIDGRFGPRTKTAVMALQHDLLKNDGRSNFDGNAPVSVKDYNHGRVLRVNGNVDHGLLNCIKDMLQDPDFHLLPQAKDPVAENRRISAHISELPSGLVPVPFIMAILRQESGLRHYHEPGKGDEDNFIVVGLDANAGERHIITSRSYGLGQYTLFHHPPREDEIEAFMLDLEGNLRYVIAGLREKFDHFVNGSTAGTSAEDRMADYGKGRLRLCKYKANDPRYMKDCKQCMIDAGQQNIREGVTPLYKGTTSTFESTAFYKTANYDSVPIRKNIHCDWPYAARRYNGAGINSYHYQANVLKNLLTL